MVRTELTHTFPVPLKQAFDYLDDFKLWPNWYSGLTEIIEPDRAAWDKPGDKVRWAYRLLGRRLEGESILEEMKPAELVTFISKVPGLPDVRHEWLYVAAGDKDFVLKVIMETEEPTTFFGKAIDRMVLPRALERDLKQTMENLADIFALGIPE